METDIHGIRLIKDKEGKPRKEDTTEYIFKDILDGYYSFIEGTEILLERADILDNIQTIKELEKTDEDKEGFKNFIMTYKSLLDQLVQLSKGYHYKEDDHKSPEFSLSGPPFGTSALSIFKKSQGLTGLGSALSFLRNRRSVNFDTINKNIQGIDLGDGPEKDNLFILLNVHFDYIRNKSKKVGNDQRYYFKIFFQSLFDPESDYFLKLDKCIGQAYKRVKERIEDSQ
ncbi:MAG: hypothetical protein WC756_07165 [Taibaiella sp.]|jgi:hypothetical protein